MDQRLINFKTSHYFSTNVIFVWIILGLVGLVAMPIKTMVGTPLLVLSLLVLTTHHRLEIDFPNLKYQSFVWILGFRSGEISTFETIEYLFIKKSRVSQTMNSRGSTTTLKKDQFTAYLKFSETDKVELSHASKKDKLVRKMKPISAALNIRMIDYSDGTSTEI